MTKKEAVQTALRKWAREPFVWGKTDCMLSVADYLIDAVGVDCGGRYRGRYSTRRGCMRVSGFHRDPVGAAEMCITEIPLALTASPAFGDVGVVAFGETVAGGLCLGSKWAARADEGVIIAAPTKILKAWAV